MISGKIFWAFTQFCTLLVLGCIASIVIPKLKSRNDWYLFSLFGLSLLTSPAFLLLSVYYEIHTFLALLLLLSWIFTHELNLIENKEMVTTSNIIIIALFVGISLARFEGFVLAFPLLYLIYSKNKEFLSTKIYVSFFLISSQWFIILLNYGISQKASSSSVFLAILSAPFLGLVCAKFLHKFFRLEDTFAITLLGVLFLFMFSEKFRYTATTFVKIINFHGNWGAIGSLFILMTAFMTGNFIKNYIKKKQNEKMNISLILLFGIQFFTLFADTVMGWRYGLSSSANRIFYCILPILIVEFFRYYLSVSEKENFT